jgi:predicted SAM-dependent methyltransferase
VKKLEIGPGRNRLGPDWDTMDCYPGSNISIVWNLLRLPYPIDDDTYDLIYMSHVLEHIPWTHTHETLKEIHRILKPGGAFEVHVPDFAKLVQGYQQPSLARMLDPHYVDEPMKWLNYRIYARGTVGGHKACFDSDYLRKCLEEAGFTAINPMSKVRGVSHGWINLGMSCIA